MTALDLAKQEVEALSSSPAWAIVPALQAILAAIEAAQTITEGA